MTALNRETALPSAVFGPVDSGGISTIGGDLGGGLAGMATGLELRDGCGDDLGRTDAAPFPYHPLGSAVPSIIYRESHRFVNDPKARPSPLPRWIARAGDRRSIRSGLVIRTR